MRSSATHVTVRRRHCRPSATLTSGLPRLTTHHPHSSTSSAARGWKMSVSRRRRPRPRLRGKRRTSRVWSSNSRSTTFAVGRDTRSESTAQRHSTGWSGPLPALAARTADCIAGYWRHYNGGQWDGTVTSTTITGELRQCATCPTPAVASATSSPLPCHPRATYVLTVSIILLQSISNYHSSQCSYLPELKRTKITIGSLIWMNEWTFISGISP